MTNKDIQKLADRYGVALSGFVFIRGGVVVVTPIGQLLSGVSIETSSFDAKIVYARGFTQVLSVPRDHIALAFGKRWVHGLRNEGWDMEDEEQCVQFAALMTMELADRRQLTDLRLAMEHARSWDKRDNIRVSEDIVHLLVLNEHYEEAMSLALDEMERAEVTLSQREMPQWYLAVVGRVRLVYDLLRVKDLVGLSKQLGEWTAETKCLLRLTPVVDNEPDRMSDLTAKRNHRA